MCRAVPMTLLKGRVLGRTEQILAGMATSRNPRASWTRKFAPAISHQASGQRAKTAFTQSAGRASLFARRLVDLTR
ncbi:hypothetical protein V8C37DRAFT_393431 [Trichoderma ceciliae]